MDGIYPRWTRFVRGFKEPITDKEKLFTEWQEGARKDIERAFGVLQAKWQWITRPILLHQTNDIALRVGTCIILHNMCVADRVMKDVRARYNPMAATDNEGIEDVDEIEIPEDLRRVQAATDAFYGIGSDEQGNNRVGASNAPNYVTDLIAQANRFQDLKDRWQHARLNHALMELKSKQREPKK